MFAKVFQKMLDSSIWTESTSTRIVWITFLLSMDSEGFCEFASAQNVATRARVKLCHTKEAIAILEAPDPQSKTPDDDGRRIQRVQGGWVVLNCKKYRDIATHSDLRKARSKSSQVVASRLISSHLVSPTDLSTSEINKSLLETEKETETEKEKVEPRPDNEADVAIFVMVGMAVSGRDMRWLVEESVKTAMAAWKCGAREAAERIVAAWDAYQAAPGKKFHGKKQFLQESDFLTEVWRNGTQQQVSKLDQLRALRQADGQNGEQLGEFNGRRDGSESARDGVPATLR